MRLVAYTDATSFGGAEKALGMLLERLDPEIDVHVLGVSSDVVERIAARRGAPSRVVSAVGNKWDWRPILEHVRTVRELRPDVFQANLQATYAGQYGIGAALLTGAKVVVVEHSPLPFVSPLQRRIRRAVLRRAAAHVAVGEASAHRVEEVLGLPRGTVRTIYNGVADVQVEELPRPAEGPTIGCIGRLSHEKGQDVLIRALPELEGVTAVIVGEGPEDQGLRRLASELGVADRVVLTGRVPKARPYYGVFDVVCIPSRHEGLPLTAMEAMLAARPIVASDVGSIAEAIENGRTGVLVRPDDPAALAEAIDQLLRDPQRRAQLGERARAVALERFTAEASARAYESLYREVLGG